MKIMAYFIIFAILVISFDLVNANLMNKLKKFFKVPKKPKMKGGIGKPHKGPKATKTLTPQNDPLFLDAYDIAVIKNEIKYNKQMDQLKKQQFQARRARTPDSGRITDMDLFSAAREIQMERNYNLRKNFPSRNY
uniref:Hypothetical secreted protein n=1 Tax=Simulium nigrimanum TaxID=683695 RepID=D1FPY4_SIMNI